MPINCQSPLVASPGTTVVPGTVVLSFVAIANRNTTATITYTLLGNSCVRFSNGTSTVTHQHPVGTINTPIVFAAVLVCGAGPQPSAITIRADVEESGAPQCQLQVPVQVAQFNCVAAGAGPTVPGGAMAAANEHTVGAMSIGAMHAALATSHPSVGVPPQRKRGKKSAAKVSRASNRNGKRAGRSKGRARR